MVLDSVCLTRLIVVAIWKGLVNLELPGSAVDLLKEAPLSGIAIRSAPRAVVRAGVSHSTEELLIVGPRVRYEALFLLQRDEQNFLANPARFSDLRNNLRSALIASAGIGGAVGIGSPTLSSGDVITSALGGQLRGHSPPGDGLSNFITGSTQPTLRHLLFEERLNFGSAHRVAIVKESVINNVPRVKPR